MGLRMKTLRILFLLLIFAVPVHGQVVAQGPPGNAPWLTSGNWLTDAQLRATAVAISGTVNGNWLTDAQLRAVPVPVSGTFWQATQPVSGTFWQATQPVSGTFWQATQPVSIATMPSTPVTGTFWQATQPVSGTFWQATQPVSGTITANAGTGPFPVSDNAGSLTVDAPVGTPVFVRLSDGTAAINTLPVSLAVAPTTPVTGTFWQATQPVSLAVAPTTPVTGTFWQATQPVSGPLTDAQLRATAVPVSGTFWQATQPVSGTVTANAGTGLFSTKELRASAPTTTTIVASITSVTCVTANANRLGASVFNDSTADLYVKLGATASTTSFITKVWTDGLFIVPFDYTGVVDCIWSSATGNARVTEVIQ